MSTSDDLGDGVRTAGRFLQEREGTTPRRDKARERRGPPPAESGEASKVTHDEKTSLREVDPIASKLETDSNPVFQQNLFSTCHTTGQRLFLLCMLVCHRKRHRRSRGSTASMKELPTRSSRSCGESETPPCETSW